MVGGIGGIIDDGVVVATIDNGVTCSGVFCGGGFEETGVDVGDCIPIPCIVGLFSRACN